MNEDTRSGLSEVEALAVRAMGLDLTGPRDELVPAVADVIRCRAASLADVEAKLSLGLALLGEDGAGAARPETLAVLRNAVLDLARLRIGEQMSSRKLS